MTKKIPVIIDCDPGLDDVIALLIACVDEKLDIRAVTVVGGNQTLEKVGNNALKALSFAGVEVPVGFGYSGPIVGKLTTASEVHGEDGLFGIGLPEAKFEKTDYHAIDLMAKTLRESEEKITIIPLGPLTNVAMFLTRYPDLKSKIERITLMGGAIYGGNTTPAAEFNIYVDPEAADIVFKSGVPITMIGLDVTQKAVISLENIERIKSIGNKVADFVGQVLESLSKYHKDDGFSGCFLHDPMAVTYVSNPEMFETIPLNVNIELKGEFTRGATVANTTNRYNKNPNADVGFEIDTEMFVNKIIDSLKKYSNKI